MTVGAFNIIRVIFEFFEDYAITQYRMETLHALTDDLPTLNEHVCKASQEAKMCPRNVDIIKAIVANCCKREEAAELWNFIEEHINKLDGRGSAATIDHTVEEGG